jgi:hypothetical protein
VHLALGFSARLGVLMIGGHLAGALLAVAVLPALPAAFAAIALTLSGLDVWRHQVSRSSAQAVIQVTLDGRSAALHRRDGSIETGLLISAFTTPALVLLTVRLPGRRRALPVVILPDAAGAQAHRRLRVWLKWAPARTDNPGNV